MTIEAIKIQQTLKNLDVKAFDSPSTITESDSDGKARLADRGFKMSYNDMLNDETATTTLTDDTTSE